MSDDEKIESHESYGMLGFYRTSSSGESTLFGSSIKHGSTIRMRLKTASKRRRLNEDRYFAEKQIVEVEMSYNQFAEIISSMNMGDGHPVTIKYLDGKRMEECPETNTREMFEKEFALKMRRLTARMKSITVETKRVLSSKTPIKAADKEMILKELHQLEQEVNSNIPFVASQFNEQMDNVVAEAKSEFEGFIQSKINSLGLKGFQAELLLADKLGGNDLDPLRLEEE